MISSCVLPDVSLLDNVGSVSRRVWGNYVEPRDVSSLSALTYFRGLRLLSAVYTIRRARVPELRVYGVVRWYAALHPSSSSHRSLSTDMMRAITAVFGVYEYVTNALPAGCVPHKARTRARKAASSSFELALSSAFLSKHFIQDMYTFFKCTFFLYNLNKK